jgi:hypothetical protein
MVARARAVLAAVVLLTALGVVGCATRLRHIPDHALAKQSVKVMERDHTDCEHAITGRPKGVLFPAELEYAACMIARNYEVYVQVIDASVDVKKASLTARIPPIRVLSDLVACENSIRQHLSKVEIIGRPAVSIAGLFFWPASVGGMAASLTMAVRRQNEYAACMKPRGYLVTPWQAPPSQPSFQPVAEDRRD